MKKFTIKANSKLGARVLEEYLKYKENVKGAEIKKISDDPYIIECQIISNTVIDHLNPGDIEKVTWAVFKGISTRLKIPITQNDYDLEVEG